ncbi:MAG: hypothetical protein J0M18_13980 [Ignavibacteria bacterium]|nr:hypothetical protein [Ignavibacteria bacterium]
MKKEISPVNYVKKFFRADEIKEAKISGYKYETTNKISVKIPLKFLDKLAFEMANAGAGIIGNYELCSFRINGTGTFRPGSKAKPFSGNKNKINFVEEIKLEMRCSDEKLDNVIDAIYKFHPYEEPDYDIMQIKFRSKKPESMLITLKKSITAEDLFKRINKNIKSFDNRKKVLTLLVTTCSEPQNLKADAVISAGEFIKLKLK